MTLNWLPDWQDAGAYPTKEGISLNGWAWEFLRRNPLYQADFHELKERLPNKLVPESMEAYPWVTGENAFQFDETYWRDYHLGHIEDEGGASLSQRLGKKYGVELMCDPAVDKPALGRLTFTTRWSPSYRVNFAPERIVHHPDPECPEIIDYGMLPEEVGEVVVKLNLEWPVETQLERLRRPLLNSQHKLKQDGLVVHDTRPQVRMYTNC